MLTYGRSNVSSSKCVFSATDFGVEEEKFVVLISLSLMHEIVAHEYVCSILSKCILLLMLFVQSISVRLELSHTFCFVCTFFNIFAMINS